MHTPNDISKQTRIPVRSIRRWCRRLWPKRGGHYRLSDDEAALLLQTIWQHAYSKAKMAVSTTLQQS